MRHPHWSQGFSGEASLDDPLLRARLVVFEEQQVSYLCIGMNHGLCDGHGICDILQAWSHFTSTSDAYSLPASLAQPRVLGERVTSPQKPAPSIAELYDRLEEDTGLRHDPFSLWTLLLKLLPSAIWCMAESSSRTGSQSQQGKIGGPEGEHYQTTSQPG